jgi:outer membrane translocation and assembly module TamA
MARHFSAELYFLHVVPPLPPFSPPPKDMPSFNITAYVKNLLSSAEKSLVINLEYMASLLEDFYLIFFFDKGNAYRYSERMDLGDLYWSSGLELRWRIPRTPIPERFIPAYSNRLIERRDSRLAFRIALGTSF